MKAALDQRIADALGDDALTSSDLEALFAEVEAAAAEATQAATDARARTLDPSSVIDLEQAAADVTRATLTADRLKAALPQLQARYTKVLNREIAAEWRVQHQQVRAEQEALAQELAALYPEFEVKIVDLLYRIEQSNAEARRIDNAKPRAAYGDGCDLGNIEQMARGADVGSASLGISCLLSLLTELKLPRFSSPGLAWPPHRPLDPALIAPRVGGDPRLHSARWHEVWAEEQQRRQRAAQQ